MWGSYQRRWLVNLGWPFLADICCRPMSFFCCIWGPKESPFIGSDNSCLVARRLQTAPRPSSHSLPQALAHSLQAVLFQWEEGKRKGAGLASALGLLKRGGRLAPRQHTLSYPLLLNGTRSLCLPNKRLLQEKGFWQQAEEVAVLHAHT